MRPPRSLENSKKRTQNKATDFYRERTQRSQRETVLSVYFFAISAFFCGYTSVLNAQPAIATESARPAVTPYLGARG
jgi:hypothetical protein